MFIKGPKPIGAVSRCAKYKCCVRTMWLTGVCGKSDKMSASLKRLSPHSRTRCTYIYATQDTAPIGFCFIDSATVIKNCNHLQPSFFLSEANTVESGNPGIPRSINTGITCPAMQRPVFEGGGRFVRLSTNSCQLHRPNTIPIFCAAVCRDYRIRTYIDFDPKFLVICLICFDVVSKMLRTA